MSEHRGTLADGLGGRDALVVKVIGMKPKYRPYLVVREVGDGQTLAYIENTNALRGLARAILRALGDEPPTTTAKPKSKAKKRSKS